MKNIGLYIHIPFCQAKCNYCDFNSYAKMEEFIPFYVSSLKKELQLSKEIFTGCKVRTIYVGGGTPSIVDNNLYGELFNYLHKVIDINEVEEFSIEANPGSINLEKLRFYKEVGINRISIGLQAWQNSILKLLGRIHRIENFLENVEDFYSIIPNINIDLIFGIPGQDINQWEETLKNILKFNITHVSAYSLKVEDNTPFGQMLADGKLKLVDDELDREMYYLAKQMLKECGYEHYEISNFAKNDMVCQHNMNYWECGEYLGIGAGSHSYLDNIRYSNLTDISSYIEMIGKGNKAIDDRESLSENDKIKEYIILGLRCVKGVSLINFQKKFDISLFSLFKDKIVSLNRRGLLSYNENCIKLTDKGFDLANQVFIEFI